MVVNSQERALIAALQQGLPLVSRPYTRIGESVGLSENEVIHCLAKWQQDGTIRRHGIVVRHRELGYQANAMVVWDVPDSQVQALGRCLGRQPAVTLCYRRPRRLPDWSYNLFCMIHGQNREAVLQQLAQLIVQCRMQGIAHEVLFSSRRFKQQGARSLHFGEDADWQQTGS